METRNIENRGDSIKLRTGGKRIVKNETKRERGIRIRPKRKRVGR